MIVDQNGFDQIDELINKEKEKLKSAVKDKAAAFQNDTNTWHDNAAYDTAIEKETGSILEINRLIDLKTSAEIISKHNNQNLVDIGDIVTVDMNDDLFDVKLTGKFLANSKEGEVTLNSPIGKAVYMKKIGDETTFITYNGKKCSLKIVDLKKQ